MEAWLRKNPPKRSQFRDGRRKSPTGLVVVHTAESVMDKVGPDTGAEGVANFIRNRDTPGSYHDIVDTDSSIKLVRYSDEAFQDGTGSNPFALAISFACAAADWPRMTEEKRKAFLHQGALAFKRQQDWLKANGFPTTPLRRVTKEQSDAGKAGFIAHGQRDPGRRSDPGAQFPWDAWFAACKAVMNPAPVTPPAPEEEKKKMFYVYLNGNDDWATDLITRFRITSQEHKRDWINMVENVSGTTVTRINLSDSEHALIKEIT